MIKNNTAGYTIVELLIALTVSVLVVTVLSSMTLTMYRQLQISRTTSELSNESQLILRAVVDDTRLAGGLLTTSSISDSNAPAGGWVTNDPSNVMIISIPAIDSSANVIYSSADGLPYKNEIIYFGDGLRLAKRTLKNTDAPENVTITTCPIPSPVCRQDKEYTTNLKDLSFTFYDENNLTTADASSARSVNLSVTLEKKAAGKLITIANSMRTTLRNR